MTERKSPKPQPDIPEMDLSDWLDRLEQLEARVSELEALQMPLPQKLPKTSKTKTPASQNKAVDRKSIALKNPALNIAVIGVRGHGRHHVDGWLKLNGAHISHICDLDARVSKPVLAKVAKVQGEPPIYAADYRKVLSDPTVDIVSIALPNHWQAAATEMALKAGKHVYVEIPMIHRFDEARDVLAAAAQSDRFVQAGTQLRANTSLAAAGAFMRSGLLGDIETVHCVTYRNRANLKPVDTTPIPAGVDLEVWKGPSRAQPAPPREAFHYHWHWSWAYGGGAAISSGIHRIDAVRFALDLQGYGKRVVSYGARFGPEDGGETPNTQCILHQFDDTWVIQDIQGMDVSPYILPDGTPTTNAIIFHGTKGMVAYNKGRATLFDTDGQTVKVFKGRQGNPYKPLLSAIENNNAADLTAPLEETLISAQLCHLGNASWRAGEPETDSTIRAIIAKLGAPELAQNRLTNMRESLDDKYLLGRMILGPVLNLTNGRNPIQNDQMASNILHARGIMIQDIFT